MTTRLANMKVCTYKNISSVISLLPTLTASPSTRTRCMQCLSQRLFSSGTRRYSRMSAWCIHQYGGNKELTFSESAQIPSIQNPDDVLVEIHAASVNPIDFRMRGGYGRTLLNLQRRVFKASEFPLILGRDFSGVVIDVGKAVKNFKPGDEIWGAVNAFKHGTHAEYTIASTKEIAKKPKCLTHIDASSVPYVGLTTWTALCSVGEMNESTTPGKRILVLAGSGGIGSFAIQFAKAWGAEVTTTCSTDAVDMVKSLGADEVIDYKTQDVKLALRKLDRFDFILDTLGGEASELSADLLASRRSSIFVSIATPLLQNTDTFGLVPGLATSAIGLGTNLIKTWRNGGNYRWAFFMPDARGLRKIAALVNEEQIQPSIDKVFQFDEIPKAFSHVEAGHARGKTVVSIRS